MLSHEDLSDSGEETQMAVTLGEDEAVRRRLVRISDEARAATKARLQQVGAAREPLLEAIDHGITDVERRFAAKVEELGWS